MSYNGSGTFLINTAGQPVVSGTVISSTAFNALTADLATGLSTAITKDGQTTVTANIPMSTYKFTGLGAGSAATDSANLSQVQSTVSKLLNTITGTNTITATASPTLSAYAAGQMFYFVAAGDNTTSVTLNIDGLGAKAVTRDGSTALISGDIKSGEVVVVVYDGTRFQIVSQVNSAGDATFANVSITSALNVGGVATFTSNPVLSGGTANGVAYLNGSKALTSGSALVFDGTNFGLGTASPANYANYRNLAISGTTGANIDMLSGSTKVGNLFNDGTNFYAYNVIAGSLVFGTNNTEQMRLTSTGLGIGTTSPARKLDVNGTIRITDGQSVEWGGTSLYIAGTSNTLLFGTSSAERMRLDSSGNLGLGVTPSAWYSNTKAIQLNYGAFGTQSVSGSTTMFNNAYESANDVYNYLTTNGAARYTQTLGVHKWYIAPSGTAGNAISFTQAMTLDASGNLLLGTTSSDGSRLRVYGAYQTLGDGAYEGLIGKASSIVSGGAAGDFAVRSAASMLFATNGNTERARITSGGQLCVGTTTTTSGARLDVKGVDSTGSNYCVFFENSGSSLLLAVQNDGRWRSGTAAASPYNFVVGATNRDLFVDNSGEIGYVSSVRASKTNITPVADTEWLLQLNPVTFNFRKKDAEGNYTDEADGPVKHGLIAEEVEAVNPDLCFYDDEEKGGALRGVNYSHLITPMLKLIQQQQTAIKELKAELDALKGAK